MTEHQVQNCCQQEAKTRKNTYSTDTSPRLTPVHFSLYASLPQFAPTDISYPNV